MGRWKAIKGQSGLIQVKDRSAAGGIVIFLFVGKATLESYCCLSPFEIRGLTLFSATRNMSFLARNQTWKKLKLKKILVLCDIKNMWRQNECHRYLCFAYRYIYALYLSRQYMLWFFAGKLVCLEHDMDRCWGLMVQLQWLSAHIDFCTDWAQINLGI